MNETTKLLKNHRSNRNFQAGYKIPKEHIEEILLATKQAPSWMNGQQYSVIVIDDENTKNKLYELSTRNPHIQTSSLFFIFCADLTRQKIACDIHNEEFLVEGNIDALINITTDAVLAMQNTATSAESLGYGTVFCGGIRMIAQEVIDMFNLPKYVYPVCGLSVGKLDLEKTTEQLKPRFPNEVNIDINKYPVSTKE